jgi:ectoine hydroxylase-related dioxygenase (phytanoyl-CoA dioxygenase family)
MPASLTGDQTAAYTRDGFLFPLRVMEADTAASYRAQMEAMEAEYPDGSLPRPLGQYFRINSQVVIPFMAEIARTPAVLDAVQSILGPDLLVWSCELFIKEAGTNKIVSWHQDLTYWGLGETDEQLTAWIALSPATEQSGCMKFVAGSHKNRIVEHRDTFDEDNLLSRRQEIAVEVNEEDATNIELQPGEMSLHHGRMFHASGPNTSHDRRIGCAIRYVTPGVKQLVAERDYAMLVRGADHIRNWVTTAPPHQAFDPDAMALYARMLNDQAVALTQGADAKVGLYANS